MTLETAPDVTYEIMNVTPEMAEEWLEKNQRNRRFRPAVANKYTRDMQHGLWMFTAEPLQFDWHGNILNGQHRLSAIAKSMTTQRFLVVKNLPPETQDSMDSGAKRTPGDALSLRGYRDGRTMASVARLALQIELSPTVGRESRNWSTGEILERIERDDYLIRVCEEFMPSLPRSVNMLVARSVLGYAMYRLGQINEEAMLEFFNRLGSLANLEETSPILALNRRLTAHATSPQRTSMYQFEQLAYVFMTWNAWRRGEARHQIKLSYGSEGRVRIVPPV